jgi:uncharacterized protein YciI
MLWVAWIEYTSDQAKVAEVRPKHREYEAKLLAEGKLALGGPLTDQFGALIVYEAETKEAAEELLKADPFAVAGVFVRWQLRPWKVVFANPQLVATG